MNLFSKKCDCGKTILGPRVGGKARGTWLGHEKCDECRKKQERQ